MTRWLETRLIDVPLDAPPVAYVFSESSGIHLTGGLLAGPVHVPLRAAQSRYEHIETMREKYAAKGFAREVASMDRVMASLLAAIDRAERAEPAPT